MDERIIIRGARVHNLKNVSLDLPRNVLIVMTGVSGSGKSSLAFDTIYAEGQRRYVESLSSYARQFLERMDKPDVDLIQGISPAMAIEQKTNTRNPRSTVGTTTEVYDYLRLLFARVGKTLCRQCGKPVTRDSVRTVEAALRERMAGSAEPLKFYVAFLLPQHEGESRGDALVNLKKEGFFRLVRGREIVDLNQTGEIPFGKNEPVLVLVDRLTLRPGENNPRLADAVETAFASGGGNAIIVLTADGSTLRFNQDFACADCHIRYEEPDPRLFSFNNPFGACPECQGFGRAVGIDMGLVVPDGDKTLREGAIQPWSTPRFKEWLRAMVRVAQKHRIRLDVPYNRLDDREKEIILTGAEGFEGINDFFRMVEKKGYKISYRVLLSRYRGYTTCPVCRGGRLRKEALDIRVGGKTIADLVAMTVGELRSFLAALRFEPEDAAVAKRIMHELNRRVGYLDDVGIGYLTLDRLSSTLSGGESQRINLATSLGSALVGALYVLDEPSIGLHPRDNDRLIRILRALRDAGNTVIVVEHDEDMIRAGDVLVDLGPKAGELGGEVVYAGPIDALPADGASLTGKYLSGKLRIPVPEDRRAGSGRVLKVLGGACHNITGLDVTIPLNMLVCVTGVSGSGKSTMVHDILVGGAALPQTGERRGGRRLYRNRGSRASQRRRDGRPVSHRPLSQVESDHLYRGVRRHTGALCLDGFGPGARLRARDLLVQRARGAVRGV
jgi:excinuclease ABC subunit A